MEYQNARRKRPDRHAAVIADTSVITDDLPTPVQNLPYAPYFAVEEQDMDDRYLTPAEEALVQIIEKTGDLPRARTPTELLLALDTSRAKR